MRPYVWFLVISIVAVIIVGAAERPSKSSSVLGSSSLVPKSENGELRTVNNDSLIIPVEGITATRLKSTFNEARGGGFRIHHAIDILAPRGTPVRAAVSGTIRKLFVSKAGGITVYEFDRAEEKCYYYAHLDRYSDLLREGMTVEQGDVIGYVGTTGNAPPGTPHLHFAISRLGAPRRWWDGTPINPHPLLTDSR